MTDTTPADEFEVWWGKGIGYLDDKDLARFTWEWAFAEGQRQARAASQQAQQKPISDAQFMAAGLARYGKRFKDMLTWWLN
jgi:hypothetical protein